MKTKKKFSWKTSLFGTLAGLATIATQIPGVPPQVSAIAAVVAGASTVLLGVTARDNKVTSEDVHGQQPPDSVTVQIGRPGGARPIKE